jgi:saxitoxin biosynthesis operon SxtJ-like protein
MRWSDIPFDPTRKTLRQFAGLWLVFFGGVALWQALVRGRMNLGLSIGALALVVGLAGLTRPEWVRLIYIGWMVLAFPIGWTVSQVILLLMYFGLFTPIGLVFRLIDRDPLQRARRPGIESYWTPKPAAAGVRSYFKQF